MTITEWLAISRRTVSEPCWCCGITQTKEGYIGYGVPFYCPACEVSWSVKIERG